MKKFLLLTLVGLIPFFGISQQPLKEVKLKNANGQKVTRQQKIQLPGELEVHTAAYFDVSPPLREMIKNSKPVKINLEEREEREEALEKAYLEFLKTKFQIGKSLNQPDALAVYQKQYGKNGTRGETLVEDANFDGVNNLDGVAPPDTQGDVSPDYYMQCVNNHTAIYDKNGAEVVAPFPTSDFWQGTSYDDRNDGDAVILWDESHERWIVTQFYLDASNESILVAVSQSSDPTGSYNRYAFSYNYMPDYPKFAVWHDGLYMGANAFDQNNGNTYKGAYISAFDLDAMVNGQSNPTNVTNLYSSQWALFPTDADVLPSSSEYCYRLHTFMVA